jgi:DNA-binding NarL/FixJ family response regulator
MTVLSERSTGNPSARAADTAELSVVLCADSAAMRRRIVYAMTEHEVRVSLTEIDDPRALAEVEDIDTDSIVVFACDVDLPREMAALRRLRRDLREPAIVAISPTATGTGVRRALDAGAVRAIASGQSVVPRKLRASVERPAFSHRERQVLSFVSRGLTNAQIADKLFLSESTIKSHLSSAFSKFGVASRKEAAALFLDLEKPTGPAVAGGQQGPQPGVQVAAHLGYDGSGRLRESVPARPRRSRDA